MKADKSPTRNKRQERAAEAQLCRELERFKKFVGSAIRQLEAGRPIAIVATVIKNPCSAGTQVMCLMVKGPPNPPS